MCVEWSNSRLMCGMVIVVGMWNRQNSRLTVCGMVIVVGVWNGKSSRCVEWAK